MGKKIISKPSPKISKAKVVRPQVFITETSRFKSLVQELTGNGRPQFQPLSSPPSPDVHVTNNSRKVGGYHYYMDHTLLEEYDHRSELYFTSEGLSSDQDRSTTSFSSSETASWSLDSWDQHGFLMEDVDDHALIDLLAPDIESWLLDF